jgi:polyadenylate-binding protein
MGNPVATTGLPLPRTDTLVTRSTDTLVHSIQGKSIAQQKQATGDKLFIVVKAFGVKGKYHTVLLLDTKDSRAPAHLMNLYPVLLKEKMLMQAATN